jgi:hypothetical protein
MVICNWLLLWNHKNSFILDTFPYEATYDMKANVQSRYGQGQYAWNVKLVLQ